MSHKAALLASTGLRPAGVIVMMAAGDILDELNAKREDLLAEQAEIKARFDAEDETDEDCERAPAILAELEKLDKRIAGRTAMNKGTGRKTAPDTSVNPPPARNSVPAAPKRDDGRGGFKSFGEFAQAVYGHYTDKRGEHVDRLRNAATTYGNEGTGADGGFAVFPEFRREIWQKVMGEDNLLNLCDQLQTGSNNMTVPKDETTPWQTSGGIQCYWEAEGSTATASKPALEMATYRLNKLFALVPVSEELLADAPAIESWLRSKAPTKIQSKVNTSLIRGTGAGQPLGILNSGCLVSVAKETSQPADTVRFANVNKMWSRMYGPCRRNAVWLINQDIEPQLNGMAFDPAATSKVPVYLPANGVAGSPYATLFGRPVIPVTACSTLGDQGDIILADMSQYMALTKAGENIRTDVSMHLYFDQALQAFRFIFRVDGRPWWGSTITPENGSNTLSCFVTLDDRS